MGAQGTAILDFGAFPGTSDASVAVAGQAGILSGSLVESWIYPLATADHDVDDHIYEDIKVAGHTIVAGTGFTLTGRCANQLNEPVVPVIQGANNRTLAGTLVDAEGLQQLTRGGIGPRLWGRYTVAWVWN